jgi:hypothetical protein
VPQQQYCSSPIPQKCPFFGEHPLASFQANDIALENAHDSPWPDRTSTKRCSRIVRFERNHRLKTPEKIDTEFVVRLDFLVVAARHRLPGCSSHMALAQIAIAPNLAAALSRSRATNACALHVRTCRTGKCIFISVAQPKPTPPSYRRSSKNSCELLLPNFAIAALRQH